MASQPPTTARIEDLKARLRLDAKSRLFYPLAEDLRKAGRADEAEKVLRDGLEHHGTYLSAWMSLGRVLVEKGEHREATEVLMRALALDPGNVVCARLLANSYLALGEKLEALKKFKLVRALLPADEEVEQQIGRLETELDGERAGTFPPPAPPPEMPSEPVQVRSEPPAAEPEPPATPGDAPPSADAEPFAEAPPLPELVPPDAPVTEDTAEATDHRREEIPADERQSPETAWHHSFAAPDAGEAESEDVFGEPAGAEPPERMPTMEEPFSLEEEGEQAPREQERVAEPPSSERGAERTPATLTMADLYARQGHLDSARDIYRRVLERDPGNEQVREKLNRLDTAEPVTPERRDESVRKLQSWLDKVGRRDV